MVKFPTSNVLSFEFGMTDPLNESISCFLIRADPWVLVPSPSKDCTSSLSEDYVSSPSEDYTSSLSEGYTPSPLKGCTPLPLEGYASSFSMLNRDLRSRLRVPGPPPDIGGRPTMRAQPEREAITQLLYILGQDFTRAAAKRRMTLLLSNILPNDRNVDLPLWKYQLGSRPQDTQWTRRSPTGPWGFQLWLWASVSPIRCLSPIASSCHRDIGITPARHTVDPEKSNRVLELPALITGLCRFYGVPVAPSKVGAGRNTPAAWGWPAAGNRRTATTSSVHLNSSTKRLERCLWHMADQ
ncbi:hypothetical protein HKD37_15G043706 [Glycine soja]